MADNEYIKKLDIGTLEQALENPRASRRLKQQVQKELDARYAQQGQGRSPNPYFDPTSGAETAGAPGFLANAIPSLTQLGDDLTTGIVNTVTDPVGTAANILPGMAQHYSQRYLTPPEGSPWYQDAVNTFNADPAGAMMDVGLLGGVIRGMTGTGTALNTAGRALERVDPVTLGLGAAQTGWMGAQAKFGEPVGASMGGSAYGMPRGRQRENLPEYIDTVKGAIEEGFPPNVGGATASGEARRAAGAQVGEIIDQLEAQGRGARRDDLVRELINLQRSRSSAAEGPYRAAVDKMIEDVMRGTDNYIGPRELQSLKETYAGLVNYDGATPVVDRLGQEGYADASGVARARLRANPELKDQYDIYQRATQIEDVTRRGAAADLTRNQNLFGWEGLYQSIAPAITGQGRFDRARARSAMEDGRVGASLYRATERTPFGAIRQGAYGADMAGKVPEDQRWHVGRLWED